MSIEYKAIKHNELTPDLPDNIYEWGIKLKAVEKYQNFDFLGRRLFWAVVFSNTKESFHVTRFFTPLPSGGVEKGLPPIPPPPWKNHHLNRYRQAPVIIARDIRAAASPLSLELWDRYKIIVTALADDPRKSDLSLLIGRPEVYILTEGQGIGAYWNTYDLLNRLPGAVALCPGASWVKDSLVELHAVTSGDILATLDQAGRLTIEKLEQILMPTEGE